MTTRIARTWLLAAATLLAGSCEAAFDGATIQQRTNPCPDVEEGCSIEVIFEDARIELPIGVAIGVWVEIRSSTATGYGDKDTVAIESEDPAVLEILPIVDREEEWVVVGRSVGNTCVSILVNETVEKDCVNVNVNARPDDS